MQVAARIRRIPGAQANRGGQFQKVEKEVVGVMKEYRLSAWPDLSAPYHRTAYRRMICDMSHRYVSLQHLVSASGVGKQQVRQFMAMLDERGLLLEREATQPDSIFDSLKPIGGWIMRTLSAELGRR
jgi:hypothetical protein